MIKPPKRIKYQNIRKSRLQKHTHKLKLHFGTLGLKALESGYITAKQLDSAKQTILKSLNKKGKLWMKVFPNVPITKKPLEMRMGKGKGSISHWVAKVKGGSILFETCGIQKKVAITAFKTGGSKLPIKTALFY